MLRFPTGSACDLPLPWDIDVFKLGEALQELDVQVARVAEHVISPLTLARDRSAGFCDRFVTATQGIRPETRRILRILER